MRLINLNSVPPSGSSVSDDNTHVTVCTPGDNPVAIVVNLCISQQNRINHPFLSPRIETLARGHLLTRSDPSSPSNIQIPLIPPPVRSDFLLFPIVDPTIETSQAKCLATQTVQLDGTHPSLDVEGQLRVWLVRLEVDLLCIVRMRPE